MSSLDLICQIDISDKKVINEFKSLDDAVHYLNKDTNTRSVKSSIKRCLTKQRFTYLKFGWIYKLELEKMGIDEFIKYVKNINEETLLIKLFPELVKEWNYELNKDIDITTISYGSDIVAWWKCLINPEHKVYQKAVSGRTSKKYPFKCPDCINEAKNTEEKKEIANYKDTYIQKVDSVGIGDQSELYIGNLLQSANLYPKIDVIGKSGGNTDIIITLNSDLELIKKCIQVKTLTKKKKFENYSVNLGQEYDDNLLIVLVNNDRDRFALFFKKEITVKGLTLAFAAKDSKYKHIMFTDQKIFLDKLIELIPRSIDYTKFEASSVVIKEKESLLRFEAFCIQKGLKFKDRETNGNSIDCYVNNIAIQMKYCSFNRRRDKYCPVQKKNIRYRPSNGTYEISSFKSCGTFESKKINRPYSEEDAFEYLIAELGGTEDNPIKYHGQFFIISKSDLIAEGILKTSTQKGHQSFTIYPPDYSGEHKFKKYWNNMNDPKIFT